ncbi:hypothetical protein ACFSKU_20865 [Pontibacter silvestris]|uniref:Uncharacterized protein n=1 Tax=Pontibacter silvestris TaxID=2305183 RepID=A0ABW4X2Y5_9BACT|nr:hypothetical protein [Pontibacter silvestris]MCC9137155.1 hypothetical protein [Pontibacter silvestris]
MQNLYMQRGFPNSYSLPLLCLLNDYRVCSCKRCSSRAIGAGSRLLHKELEQGATKTYRQFERSSNWWKEMAASL